MTGIAHVPIIKGKSSVASFTLVRCSSISSSTCLAAGSAWNAITIHKSKPIFANDALVEIGIDAYLACLVAVGAFI